MEETSFSFEEAFSILEQTVRDLESGVLSVDESVKLYERGMEMASLCGAKLDSAQLRINQLSQSEDGALEIAELDVDEL